jgi:hypothetical protein
MPAESNLASLAQATKMTGDLPKAGKIPVCDEWSKPIPRQPDGDAKYLHCTGGVRCAERDTDVWHIEPVLDGGLPCAKGFMAKPQLQALLRQCGLRPIGFESLGWWRGSYHASWSPILPGRTQHRESSADVWGYIGGNLSDDRTRGALESMTEPTHEKLSSLLDDGSDIEQLAESIGLCLRNMDIAVREIADFYNAQLVELMAAGQLSGQRVSSSLDDNLFAYVHSFFVHLGAARDYLARLIATRLGKDPTKCDAMNRLVDALRTRELDRDTLVATLVSRGYLQYKPGSIDKVEAAGWLADITGLRNQVIQKRPYGSKYVEGWGHAQEIRKAEGLYRYTRLIVAPDGGHRDVLDLIVSHYATASTLFMDCAQASGYNTGMMTLTEEDIISISVE